MLTGIMGLIYNYYNCYLQGYSEVHGLWSHRLGLCLGSITYCWTLGTLLTSLCLSFHICKIEMVITPAPWCFSEG